MGQNTKEIGKTVKNMAMEKCFIHLNLKKLVIKEISKKTKWMVKENCYLKINIMKVNSKKTFFMALEN